MSSSWQIPINQAIGDAGMADIVNPNLIMQSFDKTLTFSFGLLDLSDTIACYKSEML